MELKRLSAGKLRRDLPRVYYIAHPEDAERYRDEIARDLRLVQDCEVFYDEGPVDSDALEGRLSQMQLAVFVITASFLEDEICKKAFDDAKRLNVPILPIKKVEGGEEEIDSRFNEEFGNYELLWKEDPHLFRFYKGKLEGVLSRVFLSKEQYEDLRQAFSPVGHIFLSYQKKNFDLTQELMKTIHDRPGRDNIRVWYDEALLPGEAWDEEIETQLKNSKLMVIAVTPDILEGENYVLKKEYPLAKELGLPILPVMMRETSLDDLKRAGFDHAVIQPQDTKTLDKILEEIFGTAADTQQEAYRLGLAYLNGAYVELGRERGYELVKKAAELGDLNAVKKLARWYRPDEVKCDYPEAIKWRKMEAEHYRKHPDWSREEYWQQLRWLGAKYNAYARVSLQKAHPKFERAEGCLRKGHEVYCQILKETKGSDKKHYYSAGRGARGTFFHLDALYRRWMKALPDEEAKARIQERALDSIFEAEKRIREFPGSWANEIKKRAAKGYVFSKERTRKGPAAPRRRWMFREGNMKGRRTAP